MPEFIYQLSCVNLFIFLLSVLIPLSLISISIVRRFVPIDFRYEENTAIVSCSALLGIIYAVLIGFIILYQFGSFDKAEKLENEEGSALHKIYHDAELLPAPFNTHLRSLVLTYTKYVLDTEWPAMNVGNKIGPEGRNIIEAMIKDTQSINIANANNSTLNTLNNLQQEIGELYKAHHQRTVIVYTTLNGHVWFVLLLATLFTLGINYFLGMEFRLHVFCISLIAIIMCALIYLIVGLDRPYQGDFAVHPDTIAAILAEKDIGGPVVKSQQLTNNDKMKIMSIIETQPL